MSGYRRVIRTLRKKAEMLIEENITDDYGKELQEPGNCQQCHEMLARIDEQRGHSLCSDCRWQKSIDEAD